MKFRERVSVVCVAQVKGHPHLLGFHAVDPTSKQKYFFLPGGGIEPGESEMTAAQRETREETGYEVILERESKISLRYPFSWDGCDYDCLTHFYRARLAQAWAPPAAVQDQPYNLGPDWLPLEKFAQTFSYSPEILEAIRRLV